jgi:hypothetical protein
MPWRHNGYIAPIADALFMGKPSALMPTIELWTSHGRLTTVVGALRAAAVAQA